MYSIRINDIELGILAEALHSMNEQYQYAYTPVNQQERIKFINKRNAISNLITRLNKKK